ncbi:hypothetical protein Pcinc_008514 [Petrolisthes cinctipes]|uniref:Uncharacterized protein n=1 Tax=Petrolisthes cinctipes TaxID=88211 RepID=A0AAE1G740_PETCI|nr:hypothetical protein Pcinc_008514 [Petrolisthes cinctipes]
MESHTAEVEVMEPLMDSPPPLSPIPSTSFDVAGPSTQRDGEKVGSKRKQRGFRNVDLWIPPLTEYFLKIMKESFPLLSGKGQAQP